MKEARMDYSSLSGVPRFLTRPKAFMVSVGKDATLSCQIVGNPIPVVSWEKDKLPVQSGGRFKTTEDGDLYRLTIYDLSLEDSGQYICRAKNTIGEAFAAVSIQVGQETTVTESAPYFIQKPSNIKVTLGEDAMFKCKVQGSPPLSVNWEKDGRYLRNKADAGRFQIESAGESNALTIQCAQLGDSGTYTCRAENLIGSAKPTIPFKAKLQDLEVREKESATFQCEVPVPGTETAWFKEETKLQQSKKYNIEEEGTYRRLTVQNVTTDDDAVYICEMKEGSRTIAELSVQGNIIKKLPRKTAVFINDTATFCVELDNDCQNIRWLKNKEEVKPSDRISITRSGKQHTMTIRECKMEDAGEIAFLADESRTSTQFTVTSKLLFSDPVVKNKTETSVTLAWSPPRMDRPIPIDGYIVERKKLTGFTWVRCHESHVTGPELTVSNLSEEADYQFRVSAVNAYGQSPYLEFPGSLHLGEPTQTLIILSEVAPGGDALFTVDLTKRCSGTWYLNGKVLQESETYIINKTQTTHTLVIKNVTKKDDGAEVKFPLVLAGAAVRFTNKSKEVEKVSARLREEAKLQAELSDTEATVKWMKDGKELKASEKYEFQTIGKKRILKIRSTCCAQTSLPELCPRFVPALANFVNKEKTGGVVKAIAGKQAEFVSETSEANIMVKWYKDGKEITASKKFTVEDKGKLHKLVASAVTKEDEGTYTCKIGDDTLTFDLKVSVSVSPSESLELVCEVSAAEVKWYKDGKLITSSKKFKVESEGKSRFLVVGQVEKKDAGEYTCEAAAEDAFINKEKVQKEVKAALSENATLSCEVAQEKTEVKWYKDGKLITSSKKFKVESEGKSRRLVVGQVEKKDAGEYTCEAAGQKLTFKINVTGKSPYRIPSLLVLQSHFGKFRESATLMCEVAQDTTEVKWYKDGKLLVSSRKFKIETVGKSRRLVVEQLEKKDAGEYTCEAAGQKLTFKLEPTVVQKEPLVVQEHESITLTTSVTPETAAVRWFKDGTEIKASKKCVIKSEGASRTLMVNAAESTDSALYTCQTKDDKQEFRVQVKEIPVKFAKKLEAVKAEIGGSVSLSCELSHAKGKVTWSRNGVEIKPSKRFQIREEGTKRTLTITGIRAEDEGEYSCQSRDDKSSITIVPKLVKFVTSLISVVSEEGKEAVFKCTVSPSDAVVTWLRNGAKIEASKKYVISQKDTNHSLTITDLTLEDAAEITANAEGVESTANLRVRGKRNFDRLEMAPFEERETVTLEVELTKPAEVKWMRNSIVLKPSDKIEIKAEGTKHTLVVKDISFADRGFYCCESPDDKTQAKINVESEFSDPQFYKYPRQGLEVAEKGTVTFEVEVSHEDVEGTWQKDGVRLKPAPNVSFGVQGKKHSLTLSSVALEDAGLISFKAEGINTSGRLTVTELPVKIVKPLRDKIALWKHRGVLECQVSRANAKVRWFKKDVEIRPGEKYEIVSEGVYRKLIINDADYKDEDTYTCDAFDDRTSANFFVEAISIVKELCDEDVTEPEEANFECETSIPSVKPAKWFLKGAALQAGRNIIMQQEGTIHRLTIIKTSVDMTGPVQFSIGKSKSTANLLVRGNEIFNIYYVNQNKDLPSHSAWKVICHKYSLFWVFGNGCVSGRSGEVLIEPSEKYKIKRDQYSAELKIMKVKPEDAGVYKCKAGIAETEATLSVEGTRGLQQQGWPGAGLCDSLFHSGFLLLRRGRFPQLPCDFI
uniref:Obscurin n=1 Tax=Zosterops lateralis melanops TaxID=1220523 RepID=A0A8D2PD00_ZOSLA